MLQFMQFLLGGVWKGRAGKGRGEAGNRQASVKSCCSELQDVALPGSSRQVSQEREGLPTLWKRITRESLHMLPAPTDYI